MATISDPPLTTDLIELPEIRSKADPLSRLVGAVKIQRAWYEFLLGVTTRAQQSAPVLVTKTLTAQSAAILPTDLPLGTTTGGLYRVSTFARITVPASVNSSLTLTIGFTSGAVACSFSGAALITNTTASVQCNTFVLRSDAAAPITFAVAYVSNAAGMTYRLDVLAELLGV